MGFRRYDIIGYNENIILQKPKMNIFLRRCRCLLQDKKRAQSTMTAHTHNLGTMKINTTP